MSANTRSTGVSMKTFRETVIMLIPPFQNKGDVQVP
jgi:hypothetical protein